MDTDDQNNDQPAPGVHPLKKSEPTRIRCLAERALLRHLQGGCSASIGVQSSFDIEADTLHLVGSLLHPQGGVEIRAQNSGLVKSSEDAEAIGIAVANRILELGGGVLLAL